MIGSKVQGHTIPLFTTESFKKPMKLKLNRLYSPAIELKFSTSSHQQYFRHLFKKDV